MSESMDKVRKRALGKARYWLRCCAAEKNMGMAASGRYEGARVKVAAIRDHMRRKGQLLAAALLLALAFLESSCSDSKPVTITPEASPATGEVDRFTIRHGDGWATCRLDEGKFECWGLLDTHTLGNNTTAALEYE